ncbi:hypothetical protein I5588_12470 [Burkholderia multivorans]|uniref:hypothetical protein n=1 Tax=Burkholderia multivorans TaxID=87883 RepID=UPI0019041B08|nr:hypothetical protein [Burkholderia multivorans]MBJ9655361.1 hypothetical protein [Burkholderia multivorans]
MRIRNAVLFLSVGCLVGAQVVHAQALLAPVENFVINRAEAAIISRVAISRGFAANDPRIAATLAGMGQVSTALNVVSTGASVGLGFLGAPVWLTIAAGLGILAAGSGLYAGSVSLSRSLDGKTISASQPAPALPAYTGPTYESTPPVSGVMQSPFNYGATTLGMQVYRTSSCMASDSSCAGYPALPALGTSGLNFVRNFGPLALVAATIGAVQSFDLYEQRYNCNGGSTSGPSMIASCSAVQSVVVNFQSNADGTSQTLMESRTITHMEYNSESGNYDIPVTQTTSQPATWWIPGPGVAPISGSDLSTIYSQLSPASLSQPLDPLTLAQLTNQTWQQAANQPGYQGLPYSVTQPISYQDVQPWAVANPSAVPNIGDLFRPATDPGVSTVTISPTVQPGSVSTADPGSNPSVTPGSNVNVVNTPNVNVVNKVSVDLGADPGVASPSLEATPTISMILSPLLNLLPDLKHWSVPSHGAACPKPSFSVLGHSFTLTVQCDLAESNRTAIYTAFAAMFTVAALFVVLRA